MIAVDPAGDAHVVWMNGLAANQFPRHVYYNVWRRNAQQFEFVGGQMVDWFSRAGFCNIALDRGLCPYVALHEVRPGASGTVVTVYPCAGQPFACDIACVPSVCETDPDYFDNLWPKFAISSDNAVHLVTLGSGWDELLLVYYRGVRPSELDTIVWQPVDGDLRYRVLGNTPVIAHDVVASRRSGRVTIGWLPCPSRMDECYQWRNDVILKESSDNGLTWSDTINITLFVSGDTSCLNATHDTLVCNRDSMRAYTDLSLLFDQSDVLHAAFTTRAYYDFYPGMIGPFTWINRSLLWHWSEATGQFSLIANGWWPWPEELMDVGAWQLYVQRPSLAVDESNGYLYCAYMQYDTNCYSDQFFPMADVWISVSTDGGSRWSVGTNVTRTCPGELVPPPGSMNEREPTLAETVTDGVLHLTYVLDHDAGAVLYSEGVATLNEFIYQRIPVDSIPTTPLMPQYPLHWDSTGFYAAAAQERAMPSPREFALTAVYPNPFNGTATIKFELPRAQQVSLRIFDITGRAVTTLLDSRLTAGAHELRWSPHAQASGIYFAQLRSVNKTLTAKLLYIR
ncbi:T9SS type A sorting domain-containing protein [candidate division KSB1 bacterium]|nr:T9SS type A sorting domain-containing protein [candidate division KSB1 bacterium]